MLLNRPTPYTCKFHWLKKFNPLLLHVFSPPINFIPFRNSPILRSTQIASCSANNFSKDFSSTHLTQKPQNAQMQEIEELGLLSKLSPKPIISTEGSDGSQLETEPQVSDKDEALTPFLKFFKPRGAEEGDVGKEEEVRGNGFESEDVDGEVSVNDKVAVEYYEPKPGDFVVGVVVYGNENKLDINVAADLLGTMLKKEVLPLYDKEMDNLLCDVGKNVGEFMSSGKMGIIRNEEALSAQTAAGRPVVEAGTILFAEVLGRTLSGRPLLSARRFFRRLAWHRVRQIKQLNEPIEVRITEWNTRGLLTRIEGLRAFLPKAELVNRVKSFTELKQNVGRKMYVQITRIDEAKHDLTLSERDTWEKVYLQEGVLLEGTVTKIYPYGAQIKIGETNRRGLLHVSNISRGEITSVDDILNVDEKVKVLVMRSMDPDKISLSIAELESEPGLFISNKERVFAEAEEMARKYRKKLTAAVSATQKKEPPLPDALCFDDEANLFANWKWFKFQRGTADKNI
ncbi:hypothetical protein Dimus_005181 [Dionaea muscipula]